MYLVSLRWVWRSSDAQSPSFNLRTTPSRYPVVRPKRRKWAKGASRSVLSRWQLGRGTASNVQTSLRLFAALFVRGDGGE